MSYVMLRILARIEKLPDWPGCWLWPGATNSKGYGIIGVNRRLKLVHRLTYEYAKGPIPAGLHICHHCDTPLCVNPAHLFAGTRSDNMRDASNKGRLYNQGRTHCPSGHPLSGRMKSAKYVSGSFRCCVPCRREASKRHMRRKRASVSA